MVNQHDKMSRPASKIRFVYCPKCQKLLTEFPDIPVYKCGGCGAVLRAKDRGDSVENYVSKTHEKTPAKLSEGGYDSKVNISDTSGNCNFHIENTLQKNPVDDREDGQSSEDSESVASNKQMVLCSRDACVSDMDHGRELAESVDYDNNLSDYRRNSNVICSTDGNERRDSNSKIPQQESQLTFRERDLTFTAQKQPTRIIQSKIEDSNLNEKSHDLGHSSSDHVRSIDKVEVIRGSIDNNNVLEENTSDTDNVDTGRDCSRYQTNRTSQASDGGVSSNGHGYNKNVIHEQPYVRGRTSTKPERVLVSSSDNMSNYPEVQSQVRKASLMSSNENCGLSPTQGINGSRNEHLVTARDGFESNKSTNLQEYDIFNSVWNWMESDREDPYRSQHCEARYQRKPQKVYYHQNGSPSNYGHEDPVCIPNSYASEKFGILEQDRLKLLRMVEELKEKLSKSYGEREEAKINISVKGTQQERHWPIRHCNESKEQLQHYIDHSYYPRKIGPQQCGPSQIPFSGPAQNYGHHMDDSCMHCYPKDLRYPAQFPPCICYNRGLCGACSGHVYYHSHSPSPASSRLLMENSQSQEQRHVDREIDKLHYKEKRHPIKRHFLRAVAGGAPFVVCYSCKKLLQMPADFLLSRRRCHKLQCGACSEVLRFWFNEKTHVLPYSCASQLQNTPIEVVNNSDAAIRNLPFASEGDPVSCSDDYGLSFCKSYSTEGEPSISAPPFLVSQSSEVHNRNVSNSSQELMDEKEKKFFEYSGPNSQNSRLPISVIPFPDASEHVKSPLDANVAAPTSASPLHRLMGYSSPGEMINGSRTGDHKLQGRDFLTVADSYSTSTDDGMSSPMHKDLEPKSLLFCNAVSEEDVLLEGVGNTKDSSFTGNKSKEPKEFNLELENEKLKVSVNGRVIPDQLIKKAEEKAGRISPGNYWYDSQAGFWGIMGQPCLGIIPPLIEEFNYPMTKDCAGGNTGILVNGRELHQEDLDLLSDKGLPTTKNKAFIVKSCGQVIDEKSGKELDGLGKLAPTVERLGQGFGMHVPDC